MSSDCLYLSLVKSHLKLILGGGAYMKTFHQVKRISLLVVNYLANL